MIELIVWLILVGIWTLICFSVGIYEFINAWGYCDHKGFLGLGMGLALTMLIGGIVGIIGIVWVIILSL